MKVLIHFCLLLLIGIVNSKVTMSQISNTFKGRQLEVDAENFDESGAGADIDADMGNMDEVPLDQDPSTDLDTLPTETEELGSLDDQSGSIGDLDQDNQGADMDTDQPEQQDEGEQTQEGDAAEPEAEENQEEKQDEEEQQEQEEVDGEQKPELSAQGIMRQRIRTMFSQLADMLENDFSQTRKHLLLCIEDIPDHLYTAPEVINCVGRKYRKIINSIDYSKRKIFQQIQHEIKTYMIDNCYMIATESLSVIQFEDACDCLERDALDLLWEEHNFYNIIEGNNILYTELKGKLNQENFFKILDFLKLNYEKLQQLYDSIEEQYLKSKAEMQMAIDQKSLRIKKQIEELKRLQGEKGPVRVKRKVHITQSALGMLPPKQAVEQYPVDKVPSLIVLDGTTKLFTGREHPIAKKLRHAVMGMHDNTIENDDFILDTKGPVVAFRKKYFVPQLFQFNIFKNGLFQKIQKLFEGYC